MDPSIPPHQQTARAVAKDRLSRVRSTGAGPRRLHDCRERPHAAVTVAMWWPRSILGVSLVRVRFLGWARADATLVREASMTDLFEMGSSLRLAGGLNE